MQGSHNGRQFGAQAARKKKHILAEIRITFMPLLFAPQLAGSQVLLFCLATPKTLPVFAAAAIQSHF